VRYGRCRNHHCQSICCCVAEKYRITGKLSYHSGAASYFYATLARLIESNLFQWCHCHCYWRRRRLSFAMVGEFWVGDVPANKKWTKQVCLFSFFCFSTGIQYKSYRASHSALS
jgi:hypothetical protein